MNRFTALLSVFLMSIAFACDSWFDDRVQAEQAIYSHFRVYKTGKLKTVLDVLVSHKKVNDSTYVIEVMDEKDAEKDNPNKDSYYLHITSNYSRNNSEYGHYLYENTKEYIIGDRVFVVNTFLDQAIGNDEGFRLYFNEELGYLAGFMTSWGDVVVIRNPRTSEAKTHNNLLNELLADSTYFPTPQKL